MKTESDYLFVEVASLRCLQLMRGAKPKVDSDARKYTTLAIDEVTQGLVPWKINEEADAEVLVASGLQERVDDEAAPKE